MAVTLTRQPKKLKKYSADLTKKYLTVTRGVSKRRIHNEML